MSATVHETLARLAKARRIVAILSRAGLDDPEALTDEVWNLALEAAQIRSASEATRALVLELLRERSAA
jgi:hypothetical protein